MPVSRAHAKSSAPEPAHKAPEPVYKAPATTAELRPSLDPTSASTIEAPEKTAALTHGYGNAGMTVAVASRAPATSAAVSPEISAVSPMAPLMANSFETQQEGTRVDPPSGVGAGPPQVNVDAFCRGNQSMSTSLYVA